MELEKQKGAQDLLHIKIVLLIMRRVEPLMNIDQFSGIKIAQRKYMKNILELFIVNVIENMD